MIFYSVCTELSTESVDNQIRKKSNKYRKTHLWQGVLKTIIILDCFTRADLKNYPHGKRLWKTVFATNILTK